MGNTVLQNDDDDGLSPHIQYLERGIVQRVAKLKHSVEFIKCGSVLIGAVK